MYSKNTNIYILILSAFCIIIFGCLLSFTISTSKTINEYTSMFNVKIHALKTSNSDYISQIENLKKQMASYELEIKELKDDNTILDEKETEQLSSKEQIENYKKEDLTLLAQLIESESGNQSFEGKLAVGTVVMNRVKSGQFPDTIKGVIYQKNQFSVVSNGTIDNKPSNESLKAAKQIMEGSRVLDSDVLYFYNPELTDDKWIKSLNIDKKIGDHVFS